MKFRKKPPRGAEHERRFWDKVAVAPSGCWLWTGKPATNGYGRVKIAQISYAAHRVAYEWLVGPIPEGMELDHICHTRDASCGLGNDCPHRRCVNPAHLEPVPHRVNTLRGNTFTAEQSQRTHCPRGHELSSDNLVPSSLKKGRRGCLTCSRELAAERRSREAA